MGAGTAVVKKKYELHSMECKEERMEKHRYMKGELGNAMDTNTSGRPGQYGQSQHLVMK